MNSRTLTCFLRATVIHESSSCPRLRLSMSQKSIVVMLTLNLSIWGLLWRISMLRTKMKKGKSCIIDPSSSSSSTSSQKSKPLSSRSRRESQVQRVLNDFLTSIARTAS
uniref:Uncharacterized protein n=1 Tax=Opuntia streptacantha TaxID=393608 RepID=A0A7C9D1W0_OPUST